MRKTLMALALLVAAATAQQVVYRVAIWDGASRFNQWLELGDGLAIVNGRLTATAVPQVPVPPRCRWVAMPPFIDWSRLGTAPASIFEPLPAGVTKEKVWTVTKNGTVLEEGVSYEIRDGNLYPLGPWEDGARVLLQVVE